LATAWSTRSTGRALRPAAPGRNLDVTQIRRLSGKILADAGEALPPEDPAALVEHASIVSPTGDLLYDDTTGSR
jgi:hypothetical protein